MNSTVHTLSNVTNHRLTKVMTTRTTMITATTIPRTDVTYDALPRSFAVLLACGPPLYDFRRACTTIQHNQKKQRTQVVRSWQHLYRCTKMTPTYITIMPITTKYFEAKIFHSNTISSFIQCTVYGRPIG